MADALSTMMLDGLGLSAGRTGKATAEQDDPDTADDNAMLAMPITEVVATPIPAAAPALRRSARRRTTRAPEPEPTPVINPKHIMAETEEKPEPPRKRRHRPRF